LIIPPEEAQIGEETKLLGATDYNRYISEMERVLLEAGYRVISQDIVARVERSLDTRKQDTATGAVYTRAEKALVMGRETNADALLILNTLGFSTEQHFYVIDDARDDVREVTGIEFEQAERHFLCTHTEFFTSFHFEAKLVDTDSGDVLGIGQADLHTPNLIPRTWEADFYISTTPTSCEIEEIQQNFRLSDYLSPTAADTQIGNVVRTVLRKLVSGDDSEPQHFAPMVEAQAPTSREEVIRGAIESLNAAGIDDRRVRQDMINAALKKWGYRPLGAEGDD